MRKVFVAALVAAAACLSTAAQAQEVTKGDLTIGTPWARASAGMAKVGGGFFVITSKGAHGDVLTGGSTPVAEAVELHTHERDGEVMKMRQVPNIEVPAGQTVTLQPGGLHVMLMGLKQPLKEGETFPITLKFQKAGEVTVQMTVQGVGAMGPMGHGMPAGAPPMHGQPPKH